VLRKPVWNLYDCNFAHVISTHAVNISAHLLWMDFTGCSMIHNSQHQLHEKHEQQLPNSWNLHISVQCFPTPHCTTLGSLPCTVDVYRPSATREWLQQTCKPNGSMTSEWAVSFWRTVAWHVNVVVENVLPPLLSTFKDLQSVTIHLTKTNFKCEARIDAAERIVSSNYYSWRFEDFYVLV